MAEQMTNRARLELETYTKLHEVMKDKSGGADSIYPKLKAFSRFAQDMVTDVRGPAQSHMSGEFVEEWALACEHMQDKLRFYQKILDQKRGKKTIVRVVKQYVAVDIETQVVDAAPIVTAQPPPRLKASPALSEAQVAKHNKACQAIEGIMKDIKTRELQNKEAVKNRGKYQEELRKAQSITTEDFAKTACIAQASQLIIEAQNIIKTNEAAIKQLRESKTRYLRDCLVVQSKRLNTIPEEDGDATESISKKTPSKSKPPATKEPPKHKKRGGRAAKFAIGDDVEILYGSGSSRDWFPAQILENRGGYMVNILNSEGEIEEMEENVPVARLRARQVDAEGSDDDDDEGDEEGEVPEEDEAPNPKKRKTTTHPIGARVQARVPPFGWMAGQVKAFDEAKKKYLITFDDYPDEEASWCFPKNVISKAQK